MDQTNVKDKDIVIQFNDDWVYNVSDFLRKHDPSKYSSDRITNFTKFAQILDEKVYIDTNDPRYSHIYQGIDTIVKRVVAELTKLDPYFAFVKLRRTGSSISGVKVGLPHESDYVLALPKDKHLISGKPFDRLTMFSMVQDIVAKQHVALTEGLPLWIIHETKLYDHIGGVCLIMEGRTHANDPTSEKVGITVDLVPVYKEETTDEFLNKKAEAFLPFSLDQYAKGGDLYRLLSENYCDTGFIENLIMKQLPDYTKQSYRVAKFLLTHLVASRFLYYEIETNDISTRLNLYGCESWFSSYTLRVLFLHLLLHVHGTQAEHRLKGVLLVLCLLDMAKEIMIANDHRLVMYNNFRHPLIRNRKDDHGSVPFMRESIDVLLTRLEKEDPAKMVEEFNMLNNI